MKRAEAFPGKYLNVKGLKLFPNAERIWTIRDVRKEGVETGDGVVTDKNLMYFTETESTPIVLRPCQWDVLEDAWGDDTDAWVGKRILIYVDPNVSMSGVRTGGVRFKIPAGAHAPVQQPSQSVVPADGWPTKDQLIVEAVAVGLTKEAIGAMLMGEGRKGFNAERDTELIRGFIAHHKEQNQIADGANVIDEDDSIPF